MPLLTPENAAVAAGLAVGWGLLAAPFWALVLG